MSEPQPDPPDAPAQPVSSPPAGDVQPQHKVRLLDVLGEVEQFFARHPELERNLLTDLGTGITALERFI